MIDVKTIEYDNGTFYVGVELAGHNKVREFTEDHFKGVFGLGLLSEYKLALDTLQEDDTEEQKIFTGE